MEGFIGRALPKLVIDRTTIPFMAVPDKDVNLSQRTKYTHCRYLST